MTLYDKGRRIEWAVRDELERNGYRVLRAAGSKGKSKVDLIAWKRGEILFIQCKLETSAMSVAEWNTVYENGQTLPGCTALLAVKRIGSSRIEYTEILRPRLPHQHIGSTHARVWSPDPVGEDDGA